MNIKRPQTPVRGGIPPSESPPPLGPITPSTTQALPSPEGDVFMEDLANMSISRPPTQDGDPFSSPAWVHEEPSTWPTSYIPYIDAPERSRPTHISHLVYHIHCKGMGARKLHILMYNAIQEAETEEKKRAIEYVGYLHWPFNITAGGRWKEVSGMTEEEIRIWKMDMEEQGAQMEKKGKHMEGRGEKMEQCAEYTPSADSHVTGSESV